MSIHSLRFSSIVANELSQFRVRHHTTDDPFRFLLTFSSRCRLSTALFFTVPVDKHLCKDLCKMIGSWLEIIDAWIPFKSSASAANCRLSMKPSTSVGNDAFENQKRKHFFCWFFGFRRAFCCFYFSFIETINCESLERRSIRTDLSLIFRCRRCRLTLIELRARVKCLAPSFPLLERVTVTQMLIQTIFSQIINCCYFQCKQSIRLVVSSSQTIDRDEKISMKKTREKQMLAHRFLLPAQAARGCRQHFLKSLESIRQHLSGNHR